VSRQTCEAAPLKAKHTGSWQENTLVAVSRGRYDAQIYLKDAGSNEALNRKVFKRTALEPEANRIHAHGQQAAVKQPSGAQPQSIRGKDPAVEQSIDQ
jgi:hypothetical protein